MTSISGLRRASCDMSLRDRPIGAMSRVSTGSQIVSQSSRTNLGQAVSEGFGVVLQNLGPTSQIQAVQSLAVR